MWHYVVMRKKEKTKSGVEIVSYGIYEFFPNLGRKVGKALMELRGRRPDRNNMWTQEPMCPAGDNLKELMEDYKLMGRAFSFPVRDFETGKIIRKKHGE